MYSAASAAGEGSHWTITGPIPKARVPLSYRVATAFVAVVMVLLPLIYIGIIAAVAWWVYDYAQGGPAFSGKGSRAGLGTLLVYITPIFVGALVIVFMIKPLFHRRQKSVEPRALTREQEPELFSFIEEVCDLVRAPRPKKVKVDLQVNASAGLTHGVWSVLSRNLTLTIGLPLAGGLSVRQFGGVLAHEFGHFAQGAGMGTTYIVRVISMWFARVVYQRDQWDATLEAWARDSDWRIMIILQIARAMVWFVRRILWVLMMIGHFFSSVLMRQMEFDADHYEIQTSGSEGFSSTAGRLRLLGVGAHIAHGKQEEAFNSKRLVDDLPGWMLHETSQLSAETIAKIKESSESQKTGWLDTHPCDSERVARADKASSQGVLLGDAPASVLFSDFAALSREVTGAFYRDELELPLNSIALEPLSKMTAESDAANRGGEAMDKMFRGLLTARTLVYIRAQDLESTHDPREANAAARVEPTEAQLAAAKVLDEAMGRQNEMFGVMALFDATIPVNQALHKLPGPDKSHARDEAFSAGARLESATSLAVPFLEQARERVASALRWLVQHPMTAPETTAEIRRLCGTIEAVERVVPTLSAMRPLNMGMMAIFNNFQGASDNDAAYRTAKSRCDQLQHHVEAVLAALGDSPYPFEHAGGTVKLSRFVIEGVAHGDPMALTLLRAEAILDRLYTIYGRAIGCLALHAMNAEAAMESEA